MQAVRALVAVGAVVFLVVFGVRQVADYHARSAGLTDFWLVEVADADSRAVWIEGRPTHLCIRTYAPADARKWAARYWVASGIDYQAAEDIANRADVRGGPTDRGGASLPGYAYMNPELAADTVCVVWEDRDTRDAIRFTFERTPP